MRSTGKGVFKSDTKDSYLLDCLHVRMDWRVIMDFDRALMDDHSHDLDVFNLRLFLPAH